MSNTKLPKIILVLGMHRSGTSLITHLIAKMGINLGDDLMEANEYNPDGYWESNALVELHERMLKFTGNEWYAPINPIDNSLLREKFGDDAQKLIASMDEQAKDWCWKDPRMSIFLDFWKHFFKSREILYITVVRHPHAVAASLLKRDNIPAQVAYALFENYNLKIIAALKHEKNLLKINYDEMLSESYDLLSFHDKLQSFVSHNNPLRSILSKDIIKKSLNHSDQSFQVKLPSSLINLLNIIGVKSVHPTAESEFDAQNNSTQLLSFFKTYYSPKIKINYLQIYYADTLDGFNEEDSEIIELKEIIGITEFQIVLPKAYQFIRLDPLNDYVVIKRPQVSFLNEQSQNTQCNLIHNNAFSFSFDEYSFVTTDPQIVFEAPQNNIGTDVNYSISLEYVKHGIVVLPKLLTTYQKYKDLSNQQSKEIARLKLETSILSNEKDQVGDELKNSRNQLTSFQQFLKEAETKKEELNIEIAGLENQILRSRTENEDLKNILLKKDFKISSLESNPGYRWHKKLSALVQKLFKGSAVKAIISKYRFYTDKKEMLKSGYMDVSWYLNQYLDVKQNGVDPVWHYIHTGYLENRNPGPNFDSKFYLDTYPDVACATMNPLMHFIKHGKKEGRLVMQISNRSTNNTMASIHTNGRRNLSSNLRKRLKLKFDLAVMRRSKLFDSKHYLLNNPDVKAAGMSPVRHYYNHGWHEGRNPSAHFDTDFYLQQYSDVKASGMNPLLHYLRFGRKEGRLISPKVNEKKTATIKTTKSKQISTSRIGKKLIKRITSYSDLQLIKKSEYFDSQYYLITNPDVKTAGIDPSTHYFYHGWKEGRDPSKEFDNQFYITKYHDVRHQNINPLLHYVKFGINEGRETKKTINNSIDPNSQPTTYESPDSTPILSTTLPVKLIAFYLPQFHPIPENDKWWGKGFTEWTKVTRAKAYFEGHNQPNLPTDLGFYDLRIPDVMSQQIEMAKTFGIQAFCFHYYWFGGKRLLEKPLNMFLEHTEWDFEFCICWANENWTRRWDGHDKEILMEQNHSPDDDMAFIEAASVYLLDRRYIKINNKPLLIIYRPQLFQNMNETAQRWQKYFTEKHGIGLFLAMVQTFGKFDPKEFGLDGAIEFPPHNIIPEDLTENFKCANFRGNIYNTLTYINNDNNKIANTSFTLFRGLMLNWDNTPRKGMFGNIFINNTPENYGKWLSEAIEDTISNSACEQEKLLFINAWNEWAEGTHLEPNLKYGYAYLNETKRRLNSYLKLKEIPPKNGSIVFFSHDACLAGSQVVLLNIVHWLQIHTSIYCKIVFLSGGELIDAFSSYAKVIVLDKDKDIFSNQLNEFISGDESLFYFNSVASGLIIDQVKKFEIPIITHFHELQQSVLHYAGNFYQNVLLNSNHIIACSKAVEDYLIVCNVERNKIDLIHAFIKHQIPPVCSEKGKAILKQKLGLPSDKKIITSVGLGLFWRKGADLFIEVCNTYSKISIENNYFFLWVGGDFERDNNIKYGSWDEQLQKIEHYKLTDKIKFTGTVQNVSDFLKVSEIFLLTSREDPFPLVCLEAANHNLPIICFAEGGGMPEFVQTDAGYIVPFEDVTEMAKSAFHLIQHESERLIKGNTAHQRLLKNYTVDASLPKILQSIRKVAKLKPLVSVVVPNFNYAQYLETRLQSIYEQTFQDFEILILDDASTDNSLEIIKEFHNFPNTVIHINTTNSGSVFHQWKKGVEHAKGQFIWIAEADDLCEQTFLEKLLPSFNDEAVQLVYCNSNVIDAKGTVTTDFYNKCRYYEGLGIPSEHWKSNYVMSGVEEIANALAIKNTIPNCSAVLFKKETFLSIDFSLFDGIAYGHDWLTYISVIRKGKIAYLAESLNFHRRHENSVINKSLAHPEKILDEYYRIHSWLEKSYNISPEIKQKIIDFVQSLCRQNFQQGQIQNLFKIVAYYKLRS